MQFEKRGRGLQREAFRSEGECVVCLKQEGEKKKVSVMEVNIGLPPVAVDRNKHRRPNCIPHSPSLRKLPAITHVLFISNCMRNAVRSVRHCRSSFFQKQLYTTLGLKTSQKNYIFLHNRLLPVTNCLIPH